tara:strand:- start:579 stop:1709 length:1131 start_codon:yes stop_codon:yes gene_type:complete
MPFEQIQIGDQQSQPMAITAIYDDFLKCEMKCVTSAGESTKIVDVSRPVTLRRMDYEPDGERLCDGTIFRGRVSLAEGKWDYVSQSTKRAKEALKMGDVDVDKDGIVYIMPPYEVGDTIYVTKNVSESICQPQHDREELMENTTVEVFIDENRDGRSWEVSGAGISGYGPKCITFCEDGKEVMGQILFKTGCPDTPEGPGTTTSGPSGPVTPSGPQGGPGGTTEGPNGGPDGPDGPDDPFVQELLLFIPGGTPGAEFNPIKSPHTAGYTTTLQSELVTNWDDGQNLISVEIPESSTKVGADNGDRTIIRPAVGSTVKALGGNTFAADETCTYPCSNLGAHQDFLCGSWAVTLAGDGTDTATCTALHWLPPHADCED